MVVGRVLARLGASAESSFAVAGRAVRLVMVLAEVLVGLGFTFGDRDVRERGTDVDDFLGVAFTPIFSPTRVSISTR